MTPQWRRLHRLSVDAIFDAHLHYSHDAWEVVPTQEAQTPFLEASTEASESEGYGDESTFSGWSCQLCVNGTKARLQYADMREDRVVFYGDENAATRHE